MSDEGDIDGAWKEQASLRLDQVLIWDIDKGPLKSNPQYAKYFQMLKDGSDVGAVKKICQAEDMIPRVLDLDPNLPLEQQLQESTALSESTKNEIRYSAIIGDGATPESLEAAVNSLHKLYVKKYIKVEEPPPPPPRMSMSLTKSLKNSIANSFAIRNGNKETTNKSTATPVMATPINKGAAATTTPVVATPVKATPVKKKKGRFGIGGGGSRKVKKAKPKNPMDEKEELREREMQEIRELHADQREQVERRKEKKKVDKMLTGRALKLQLAMDELELVKDQLLDVRLKVDEKNAEGTELIAQIQILQIKLDQRTKYEEALATRVDDLRKERGMAPRLREEAADDTSAGYSGGSYSEGFDGSSGPSSSSPVISISDKLRADEEDQINDTDTPKTKRRKSARSRRKRKSSATAASKRSAASKRREPNFDPEFLIEKFQEAIRKLITINRFFQQANDLAMSKEKNVDQKSFGMRKSVLTDLVMPDFEDEEWQYFDVEIEDEDDEDEEGEDEDTVEDSLGPLPSFGRKSLQAMPMFSPAVKHGRKSLVLKRTPSSSTLPPPPPINPDSKVKWNDEKLYTVRVIPRIPADLFYTTEEIKLFRFEKFMDDNADEFEVVDDEEWEEEEIIEDDDSSLQSYDDESYYSEEEDEEAEKPWSYDESAFEIQQEEPPAPPANENETPLVGSKSASVDNILGERSLNTDDIGISDNNAGGILDDLIDQVDALLKRKTADEQASSSSEEEDPASDPHESLTSDQIHELRRTFHAFDTNGSGYIEHDELKINLKTLGYNISEEGIDNLLSMVESKDNRLNFEEFIAWNGILWKDDMKEKFKAIDSTSRGYIGKSQLKGYVAELGGGFDDEALEELCYEMDPEGNDRILLDDFIQVMASSQAGNSFYILNGELYIEKLRADFRSMDADNSGYITRENLQEMTAKSDYILSEKELDDTMKAMDLDGNGQISIDEFIAVSVRIKDPSAEEKTGRSSTSGGFPSSKKDGVSSSQRSSGSDLHRLSEHSISLLSEGNGALETVVETDKEKPPGIEAGHDEETPKASPKSSITGGSERSEIEAGPDEETPKASPKSSITGGSERSEIEAGPDEETPKASPKSSTAGASGNNTEGAVQSGGSASATKEKPSLSNFLGRTSENQQGIRQISKTSLSLIDQKRTGEMSRSSEVSMSELSALTSDIFGSERFGSERFDGSERYSAQPSPVAKEPETESTKAAPAAKESETESAKAAPADSTAPQDTESEIKAMRSSVQGVLDSMETPAEDTPSEVDGKGTEEVFVPDASLRMSSITVDEAAFRTSQIESAPDNKTEEKAPAPAPVQVPDIFKSKENAPAPAPVSNAPAPSAVQVPDIFKTEKKAPAPAPAPVPNVFKKKSQFLRTSNSKLEMQKKASLLRRQSTHTSASKSSMSSAGDWGSSEEFEADDTPKSSKSQTSQADNNNASLPLVSLGDKLEADKEAGVADGPDGTPKKRRRKRKPKKKPEREPNLDPTFLREAFKTRIRKLISLNRFFSQATDAMFDKEKGYDRKSFGATAGGGVSLLNKMSASDISELEDVYDSDSDEDTDEVRSMLSFASPKAQSRGLDRELSVMSMASTTTFAPPLITAEPKRSAVMTAERKKERANVKTGFKPENKMHKVKLIPFLSEEQTKELFWTGEELKLFRFEKFMEDNSNEFELVDDDEVEYEEEEYEEVSWVSGEEESYFDEETIEDSMQANLARHGFI